MPLRLLVVASETPKQRDARRKSAGQSSDETYADTLRALDPSCDIEPVSCVDGDKHFRVDELAGFSGILFAGSPIQMQEKTSETRSAAAFMREVFEAGTPSFGSCAGLQIATVAAGGTCKARDDGMQAGFSRGIVATPEGRTHPMLQGRPLSWTAPALHSSIVDRLPSSATVLAQTNDTPVEALEIRSGSGVFWGVQYHPEIAIGEIAASLRRQSDELVEEGLAADPGAVDAYSRVLETLDADPERRDLAWQIGLDDEVLAVEKRTRELRNFLSYLHERAVA